MANLRDPAVVARDFLLLVKLWHVVAGLYIWEFTITLDYEWSIIWGRRPYRWTIWLYSFTRVATLVALILAVVDFDAIVSYNCQLVITSYAIFAYLALATAELLIVLRIIAIWKKKKVIVAIAIGIWAANVSFLIQAISRFRSGTASPDSCVPYNIKISKLNVISTLVTDIVLLLIMLVGLLQLRVKGVGMLSLGRLLWKQGIIWLFIATVAGALPVVFISLDLNDALRITFQVPSLITVSIAATRMYRSLTDFVSGFTEISQGSGCPTVRVAQTPTTQVPPSRVGVAAPTSSMEYLTPRTSDDGSYASTDKQVKYKPHGLTSVEGLVKEAENCITKYTAES